jgi:hypothetical protein
MSPDARRATPLTLIRFRAPPPSAPDRANATSIVSGPARPSIRATSAPHRMSSASVLVRCERPQASRTIASRRLVLPAAFGPTTRWGPPPKASSAEP